MLCSQTCRDSPLIMYSERGSAVSVKRSHLSPAERRNRNLQEVLNESPKILSKCGLSRCHPMPTPASYSVQRTCWTLPAGRSPNFSTDLMTDVSQPGIGSASSSLLEA